MLLVVFTLSIQQACVGLFEHVCSGINRISHNELTASLILSPVVEVLFVGLHPLVEVNKLKVSAAVCAENVRMFNNTIRCLII